MRPFLALILLCLPHVPAGAQTPGGWNGSVVIPPAPTFSPIIPHFAPLPVGSTPTAPSWPWENSSAIPPDMNARESLSPDRYQRDWSAFRQHERQAFRNRSPDSPP
ncbi:hypothetical protein JCM25156A_27040 [Komagataeibacter kakiaceti JCM 25156]|uniref:hypothetical protein n=1 Tax=Komagataeibacter kakiaceti TaxID=943261 RepID=UPI000471B8F8|nr:hypothetical protein [Komagataeibacter kakiaceti]